MPRNCGTEALRYGKGKPMGRRDYEDDPDAPVANSLVPAASAVVDDRGRILLQRRRDNGMWALPGGAMHIGESLPDCAVRETREETGFDVEIVGVGGTYSNPRHVFAYDDGEVRQEFSVCFLARPTAGRLAVSGEIHGRPLVPAVGSRHASDGPQHPQARERLARRQHARSPLTAGGERGGPAPGNPGGGPFASSWWHRHAAPRGVLRHRRLSRSGRRCSPPSPAPTGWRRSAPCRRSRSGGRAGPPRRG